MALPAQVQAALDAADATLASANAQSAPEVEPPQQEPPAFSEPPAVVAPAEPVEVTPPDPTPQRKFDEWEARYKTLQGLFNKEVPALQGQVRELQRNLSEAVDRLNRASAEKEAAPVQTADPKDVDAFGSDLVEMVNRVASAAISQATRVFDTRADALEGKLKELEQQLTGVTQTTAMTAEQAFFDRIGKLVPNWEEVNASKPFLAWLAEIDPVYGVPRQQALDAAQQQLNPERAAAVFNAFLGPKKVAPKANPLDSMVSPKGAATVAPAQAQPPVITQAQITQFYNEVRQGKYRGNDAEAQRIEGLINAALAEGRVR